MKISGFEKLTLLDYPGKVACIIFTQGCNYKCKFCQNSSLIGIGNEEYKEQEILDYLEKRKNILDGVVISGGEPTLCKGLKSFIKKIKELKLLVKLDTNGTNPQVLNELISEKLIDYIAMDIKNTFACYEKIVDVKNPLIERIKESIDIIKNSGLDHEFRTTIMKEHHNIKLLKEICEYIGKEEKYYIQNFRISDYVIDKTLTPFDETELLDIKEKLTKEFPNAYVRGI